jgi:hypothetical protein
MTANACRSASNRAMTCLVSMPSLITLRATRRRSGTSCSARYTIPIPPSPTSSRMRYGPIRSGRLMPAGPGLVSSPLTKSSSTAGSTAGITSPASRSSRLGVRSCAANNDLSSARIAGSSPQISMNWLRASADNSTARSNSSARRSCRWFSVASDNVFHLPLQPRLREHPVSLHRSR